MQRIESGQWIPSAADAYILSMMLGVDINELFTGVDREDVVKSIVEEMTTDLVKKMKPN